MLHQRILGCAAKHTRHAFPAARVHFNSVPTPVSRLLSESTSSPAASHRNLTKVAAVSLESIPTEYLLGGASALLALVGVASWSVVKNQSTDAGEDATGEQDAVASSPPPPPPRENAVLVFGATGRLGRIIVQKLIASGRTVVAAVRSADKAQTVMGELGLSEGRTGNGILFLEQVDVTDASALTQPQLWRGVTQVVSALGPVFGPQPGGGMGYIDNMSPERVDALGVESLMSSLPQQLSCDKTRQSVILPMTNPDELAKWERLDDVIMGGQSSSKLAIAPEGQAVWSGDLITEGGGFCGTRTVPLNLDLSAYDGLTFRIKGDGQIFKFNIKTKDQDPIPESTYQATFDTVEGDWTTVTIPWHNFVCVKRAQYDPDGAPLDPSQISKFGLVLSRFEFNKMPNPIYKPGPFQLEIDGGIKAYREPRPQVVLVSSAAVERNALVGDDPVKRKLDVPIVQLNPGGVLNHKYTGEVAVRSSGYPYTVIRPTGMSDLEPDQRGPCLLEADQGDRITGVITREEVADVVVRALSCPEAVGKTFEVRRKESADAKGLAMTDREWLRMFIRLSLDRNRWRAGLPPFPKAMPPPPPVTEEQRQQILNDPRVQAVAARAKALKEAEAAKKATKEAVTASAN